MIIEDAGPTDVFTGPMATAITRRVKCMKFITNATFTTLTFMFTSGESQAVAPTGPTYPALFELGDIKTFRLLTGSAVVTFYANV
jgi:hypothetical protein